MLTDSEGGQLLLAIVTVASAIWGLSALWPAFGQLAGTIVQITALYFKTGLRG